MFESICNIGRYVTFIQLLYQYLFSVLYRKIMILLGLFLVFFVVFYMGNMWLSSLEWEVVFKNNWKYPSLIPPHKVGVEIVSVFLLGRCSHITTFFHLESCKSYIIDYIWTLFSLCLYYYYMGAFPWIDTYCIHLG